MVDVIVPDVVSESFVRVVVFSGGFWRKLSGRSRSGSSRVSRLPVPVSVSLRDNGSPILRFCLSALSSSEKMPTAPESFTGSWKRARDWGWS